MPASEIMKDFKAGTLHSGPGGKIVKSKKQARAIQLSYARKEGHDIPEVKGSFQDGGLVPETGKYKLHEGERVIPVTTRSEDLFDKKVVPRDGGQPSPGYHAPKMRPDAGGALGSRGSFKHGGIVPKTGIYKVHRGEEVISRKMARRYAENKR